MSVQVYAHRGSSARFAEHTRAAYLQALADGADAAPPGHSTWTAPEGTDVLPVYGPEHLAGLDALDTWPGLRPEMVLSEAIRPQRWVEQGSWHGVRAELTLSFAPQAGGCRVGVDFRLWGAGVLRPIGPVLTKISRPAVLADLRRAARILEVGGQPEAR